MTMKMLDAGGLPTLTDGVRTPDESNPKGYYEFEPVKQLDKNGDTAWLADARGKGVKIISFLLTFLPETFDYQVISMQRDLDEVLASQNKMLVARGERPDTANDPTMRRVYEQHLEKVDRFLRNRRCFTTLTALQGRDRKPGCRSAPHQQVSREKIERRAHGGGCRPRALSESKGIIIDLS